MAPDRPRGWLAGPVEASGGHRGSVASAGSGAWWRRARRCPGPSAPGGDALCRTRRIVRGGCVEVVRRVVAAGGRRFPVRSPRQVVQGVRLVGSRLAGEQAVRLRPQELSPGRPDPAWRRPEASSAKHRGDARGRDVDAELQEFPSDPEVSPPGILPAQAKDQMLDRGIERGTTGPPGPATSLSPQEVSVPPGKGCPPEPGSSSTGPGRAAWLPLLGTPGRQS